MQISSSSRFTNQPVIASQLNSKMNQLARTQPHFSKQVNETVAASRAKDQCLNEKLCQISQSMIKMQNNSQVQSKQVANSQLQVSQLTQQPPQEQQQYQQINQAYESQLYQQQFEPKEQSLVRSYTQQQDLEINALRKTLASAQYDVTLANRRIMEQNAQISTLNGQKLALQNDLHTFLQQNEALTVQMAQLVKYSALDNKDELLQVLNIQQTKDGTYEQAFQAADEKFVTSQLNSHLSGYNFGLKHIADSLAAKDQRVKQLEQENEFQAEEIAALKAKLANIFEAMQ